MEASVEELYKDKEAEEGFRDRISTVDEEGKRVWIYPKKSKGKLTNYRGLTAFLLLLFLIGSPFIKVDGQPFLLFNIFERKFIIFGQVFWPQDFFLAVVAMITSLVIIVLFTVVFGRIFCGWICPQTIFMEWVFRRVEYWIEGDYMAQKVLNKKPWNTEKIIKKTAKQAIFLLISALIMHTFMAYIVGVEKTWELVQAGPGVEPIGFLSMVLLTGAFYGVFGFMREQVCTTICPYGRLQGVLLDRQSIVVAYDHVRGEPKGNFRKNENRADAGKGDCIDCKKCVYVCPTGIDIRHGTQLECVNCTACIDACNSIMDKVDLPRGLIRYASEQNIADKLPFRFTGKMKAYTTVLVFLIGFLVTLMVMRSDFETTILRTPGMMYQTRDDGSITNLYQIKIVNKTNASHDVSFKLLNPEGKIEMVGSGIKLEEQGIGQGAFFVIINPDELSQMSTKVEVGVYAGDELVETVETKFLGPAK
ncbi:MAG: cytochrome c oxidase accessory protein CcoG [Cyclobacteriaceae bacterium]